MYISKPDQIAAETVAQIAAQTLRIDLSPANAAAAAGMLNALAADMEEFRRMPPGDHEPATTYAAVEGES
jgi:hypothetical protein